MSRNQGKIILAWMFFFAAVGSSMAYRHFHPEWVERRAAQRCRREDNPACAVRHFFNALQHGIAAEIILDELASSYFDMGKSEYETVLESINFERKKRGAYMLETQAMVYYMMGEYSDAIATYERAINIDPARKHLLVLQARLLEKMGRFEDAEARYSEFLSQL